MNKLYFKYGAMTARKTIDVITTAYKYNSREMHAIIVKPKIDTKGSDQVITRIGESVKCDILIPKSASLLSKKYFNKYKYMQFILVDEAQFLSKKQINELWFIAHKYDINVICYALKSNFKGDLFEGSSQLLARSDEKHELVVNCSCGKPAMFNARRVNGKFISSGKEVVIDGSFANIEYIPLCSDCYLEFVLNGKLTK